MCMEHIYTPAKLTENWNAKFSAMMYKQQSHCEAVWGMKAGNNPSFPQYLNEKMLTWGTSFYQMLV